MNIERLANKIARKGRGQNTYAQLAEWFEMAMRRLEAMRTRGRQWNQTWDLAVGGIQAARIPGARG
jgi:hypothetical protein